MYLTAVKNIIPFNIHTACHLYFHGIKGRFMVKFLYASGGVPSQEVLINSQEMPLAVTILSQLILCCGWTKHNFWAARGMHTSQVRPSQVACKERYSGNLHAYQADVNGVSCR